MSGAHGVVVFGPITARLVEALHSAGMTPGPPVADGTAWINAAAACNPAGAGAGNDDPRRTGIDQCPTKRHPQPRISYSHHQKEPMTMQIDVATAKAIAAAVSQCADPWATEPIAAALAEAFPDHEWPEMITSGADGSTLAHELAAIGDGTYLSEGLGL